jgi:hypothetical protein
VKAIINQSRLNPTDDLIEALAEIEHEQWRHWSQAVAADVPAIIRDRWQRSWVGYAELTEELKEADRVWARKVAALLRNQRFHKL